jgi:hypothetical protein
MGATCSRRLALLLYKEEWGLLEGLVLEGLGEQLPHNVTYREANTCNQSIKCNKHVSYECTKRKRK